MSASCFDFFIENPVMPTKIVTRMPITKIIAAVKIDVIKR